MADFSGGRPVQRFGVFEVDLGKAELRKSGVRLKLHDQPYRILTLLLDRPGELVTREELRRALWPEETFVDFDHSLNSAVNKLRETLADSASTPRYIETVPRRGYRFILPVESIQTIPVAPPTALAPPELSSVPSPIPTARPRRFRWAWHLPAAGLAGVLVSAVLLLTRSPMAPDRIVPFTSSPGFEVLPTFSPDARQIAFAWNGEHEDNYDIYVRLLGSEQALRLTSNSSMDTSPAWSPDGNSIAFLRLRPPETFDAMLISPLGGSERRVGELRRRDLVDIRGRQGTVDTFRRRGIAWMPNGEWLVVTHLVGDTEPAALFLLSVRTGEKRQLTFPNGTSGEDRSPSVSPDGRRVAFVRGGYGVGSQIYVLDIDANLAPTSQPVRLTSGNWVCGETAFTTDGQEIVFSAGTTHITALWRVSTSGAKPPMRIDQAGDRVRQPALAGTRLIYSKFNSDINIWRFEVPPPNGLHTPPARVLASTYVDHMPQFSPDGQRIAFISSRTGSQEIWLADSAGANATRLTFLQDREVLGLRWSPDGTHILFHTNADVGAAAHSIDAAGGPPVLLVNATGVSAMIESHDGQWFYFQYEPSGAPQIWKAPRGRIAKRDSWIQVTRTGGASPGESKDGRFLYYVKREELWKMPLPEGDEQQVLPSIGYPTNYVVVDAGIYFIPQPREGERDSLHFLDFATGKIRLLHTLDKPVMYGLSVSPDGRSVLYTQMDHWGSDLMLFENFR